MLCEGAHLWFKGCCIGNSSNHTNWINRDYAKNLSDFTFVEYTPLVSDTD